MIKHYKIIPISSYNRNMYDAISEVADVANVPRAIVLEAVGLDAKGDVRDKLINPPTNYFSVENLLMTRLNNYCQFNGLDIRISRPIVRRPVNEIQNNSKNSRRNSLGRR